MERGSSSAAQRLIIPVQPGLELRGVVADDAAAFHHAIERNRARLREWLPWLDTSRTFEEKRDYLAQCVVENEERTAYTAGIWAGSELAGAIGLHRIDLRHRNTSVGYWLAEEFAGQGMMTKACKALITVGFDDYRLHRIEIRCAVGNNRSAGIARRLGFQEEGVLVESEWLYDHWVDLRVFSMLEQNWRERVQKLV